MLTSIRNKLLMASLFTCFFPLFGCLPEDGQQVVTPARINTPVSDQTVDVVLLDGQSNALRLGLDDVITRELSERTGRKTELIVCAVGKSPLQTHLLGGDNYKACALKRILALSQPNRRLVGAILIQGEANINDTPYIWSDLFEQYTQERREDLVYETLPIVFSQLPNTVHENVITENVEPFKQNQQLLSEALYDNNVRMVTTDHLPLVDGVHFENSASPEFGEIMAEKLYQLLLIQQANGINL